MIIMQRVNLQTDKDGHLKGYGMQSHLPCSGYVSPARLFKSQTVDHIVVILYFLAFVFDMYSKTKDKTWCRVD
jgi:hypothetical protein